MSERRRDRFDGHILGVGTASGHRFVVGVWQRSPFGAFADVMVAHPDGRRELLAPNEMVAEYVSETYRFDDVTVESVEVFPPASRADCSGAGAERSPRGQWRVVVGAGDRDGGSNRDGAFARGGSRESGQAPMLDLSLTVGARGLLAHPLRFVRGPFVHPLTARTVNPVAARIMPGVRTVGTAGNGRREFYLAQDLHSIDAVRGTWRGVDVGALADVHPEPNFGFSSTPRSPACTTVTTFIDLPARGYVNL